MILYFIQIILKSIIIYLTLAILLGLIPLHRNFKQTPTGTCIYILSNGVHTDIVLPVKSGSLDWSEFFKETKLNTEMKYTQYIAFGWGSREFYINTPEWKDLTIKTAINALFLKGEPAMHVTLIDFTLAEGKLIKPVYLSGKQFESLSAIIRSCFVVDKYDHPVWINAPGYGENDLFFEAGGRFNIFRTCNVWTSECLKYSGIRCGVWTPFDFSVLYQLSSATK